MPDKMMNRGGGVVVLRDGIGLVCLGWVGGGSLREGGGGGIGSGCGRIGERPEGNTCREMDFVFKTNTR